MLTLAIALLIFASLFYLLLRTQKKQAIADYRRKQAARQLALKMHPTYRQALQEDRHYELARQAQEHKQALERQEFELKRTIALQWREVAQYGLLRVDQVTGELIHIAPTHKPLAIKSTEDQDAALAIPGTRTFSQVLATFRPSSEHILLGYLPGETPALASAEGLCHVALAGATGGGKSVLVRLLMSQLCFVGASVLLLNPHYTRYDLRAKEDWTPFEPYLFDDPMRCRQYAVIGEYLRHVAQDLLPVRLDLYARSLPTGKPFYIILDELPAIVKHVPEVTGYLADLLREGRKVGLFVVCAAQDYLVRTIMKDEGGAVRDCFRTSIYVGGDAQTARILLDVKGTVDDGSLGKGVVMLRCEEVKQAQFARVPYVDNESLYQLLGPSTYVPATDRSDIRQTSTYRPVAQDDAENNECPDTVIVDADPGEMEELQPQPGNVRTFPKMETSQPVETNNQVSGQRPKQYRLSDIETEKFITAFRLCNNREKALNAINRGSNYREHAEEIIRAHNLRKDA